MADWDIRKDYRFNKNQHCTAIECDYDHSHTVGWCGIPQDRFCECAYCYVEGVAEEINEQMQLPLIDNDCENFPLDIADHKEFNEFQHCNADDCYTFSHTFNYCKQLQDHFCECAYCYDDGTAAHLNSLHEQAHKASDSEDSDFDI